MKRTKELQSFTDTVFAHYFGRSITQALETKTCTRCHKAVGEFRDDLSKREYEISGMCQGCQDIVFVALKDEEG